MRVVVHTAQRFANNLGGIQAAGLSMITLLALGPMLILVFGVAKGFGFGDFLDQWMKESTASLSGGLQGFAEKMMDQINAVNFGALGLMGSLIIAYSGFALFTKVELTFNHVWKAGRRRPWYRRITDFIALLVIVPLLVAGAIVLSSLLHDGPWVEYLRQEFSWLAALYDAGLGMVPHMMLWIAFTAIYQIMPSTKVQWRSALIAGVFSGSAWLLIFQLYLKSQSGVASLNPITGVLAALPLLLIYLQVTWSIVLVGAEVSYAVQNVHALRAPEDVPPPSHAAHRRLVLLLVDHSCRRHLLGEKPLNLVAFAQDLDVPKEWVDRAYQGLHDAGILAMVADQDEDGEQVLPAKAPDRIGMAEALDAARGGYDKEVIKRLALPSSMESKLKELDRLAREAVADGRFGN